MTLRKYPERAREIGKLLLKAYRGAGIFGETDMPEDLLPSKVQRGSEEQLHFITLTVAIDYMRDSDELWASARETYADHQTRYLFNPEQVVASGIMNIVRDMKKHRLARRVQKDTMIWQMICLSLVEYFDGQVEKLLKKGGHIAPRILDLVRDKKYRFPYLKGPKIGPLWIRMLADSWKGSRIKGLKDLPLPVDIHTAAATVMTGCVRGEFKGRFEEVRDATASVWLQACKKTEYYPLLFDQPLWHLSRNGCRNRSSFPCEHRGSCPVGRYCTETRLIVSSKSLDRSAIVRFERK